MNGLQSGRNLGTCKRELLNYSALAYSGCQITKGGKKKKGKKVSP